MKGELLILLVRKFEIYGSSRIHDQWISGKVNTMLVGEKARASILLWLLWKTMVNMAQIVNMAKHRLLMVDMINDGQWLVIY